MIAAKPKMGLVLLLAVGVVAAGVDTLVQGALSAREPEAKQAAEPKPPVERQPVRTDQYGDSLPEGAIARLGTLRFRHPKMVDSLVFTANGKTLVSACFDGIIRFWDPETGKETRRILSPDSRDWGSAPFRLALSWDSQRIIDKDNSVVRVWDQQTGKQVHCWKGQFGPGLALSPDGQMLAVGHRLEDTQFALWNMKSGRKIGEFGTQRISVTVSRPAEAFAFSPDGKILAAGDGPSQPTFSVQGVDGNSTIRLWEVATGREVRQLKGHTGGVTSLVFSPDGQLLVSSSYDSTLRFWDPATGNPLLVFPFPDDTPSPFERDFSKGVNYGGILTVAFSPNGRLIASGSSDGKVRRLGNKPPPVVACAPRTWG